MLARAAQILEEEVPSLDDWRGDGELWIRTAFARASSGDDEALDRTCDHLWDELTGRAKKTRGLRCFDLRSRPGPSMADRVNRRDAVARLLAAMDLSAAVALLRRLEP